MCEDRKLGRWYDAVQKGHRAAVLEPSAQDRLAVQRIGCGGAEDRLVAQRGWAGGRRGYRLAAQRMGWWRRMGWRCTG